MDNNRDKSYQCPETKRAYPAHYFNKDKFCMCCTVSNLLIPFVEPEGQSHKGSWAYWADTAE